jgi:hypothetical protein
VESGKVPGGYVPRLLALAAKPVGKQPKASSDISIRIEPETLAL